MNTRGWPLGFGVGKFAGQMGGVQIPSPSAINRVVCVGTSDAGLVFHGDAVMRWCGDVVVMWW